MSKHLERELDKLRNKIYQLCALVEESLSKALRSINTNNKLLANEVIQSDNKIDTMEIEVEEECLKILALHQPVAIDLRFIVAALKINNDLERIGDISVNIAGRGYELIKENAIEEDFKLNDMFTKALVMLKKCLDSFSQLDTSLAHEVCHLDDDIDKMYRQSISTFNRLVKLNPEKSESFLQYITIARHLERVGDHAENIAEDVIYMVDGDIVRHQEKE